MKLAELTRQVNELSRELNCTCVVIESLPDSTELALDEEGMAFTDSLESLRLAALQIVRTAEAIIAE